MTEGERIGRHLKSLRIQSGCTQEEVANELFISQSYLRRIEHSEANPSVNMVYKINSFLEAKIKGVEPEETYLDAEG